MATYADQNAAPTNARSTLGHPVSRLEHDIERIKELTRVINSTTERTLQIARTLGYFQDQPKDNAPGPIPVVTTMQDAISELNRAVDHNSGCLNIFD